jgi:hypothetical protein
MISCLKEIPKWINAILSVGQTNEWSLLKNQFDVLVRTFRRPLIMAALRHSLFS